MSIYLEKLNNKQKTAVLANGNVLITACPGSGKTRVIAHKVAYEIESIIETKKLVIALTYTNRAADEIKRRVENFDIDTSNLWTGTIHSFCLEWIIKPYVGYIKELKNGFTIVDEIESDEIINDLKTRFGIARWTNIKRIYKLDGGFIVNDSRHLPLIEEYKKILHDNSKIDFDDILYYSYRLLINRKIISSRLSNIFHLICVDEYQDTQELQYSILSEIIKANKNKTNIFFVGDVCQAIYGSIGGIAKTVHEIQTQFGIKIDELELSGNYRSNQRIIDYYSNYQINKIKITAVSSIATNNGHIAYDEKTNKDDIHKTIAEIILQNIKAGIPANEICVMAPQWWMVLPMGRKLKSQLPDIDFDAFGLSPFRRVRDNIWYKAIRLFLSTPSNSNYVLRYQWVTELIVALDEQIPDLLTNISNRKRYLLRLVNFFKCNETDSLTYIEEALEYFMICLNIEIEQYPFLKDRRDSFMTVVRNELQREDFDYATEISTLKRIFNRKKGVVVNTCHGVKGEEYETVIAYGLLDGYVPNWSDLDKEASLKLLYVICSRAKNNLYLFSELGHSTKAGPRSSTPALSSLKFQYDCSLPSF